MLSSVHIENIALITSLNIDFQKGFSVFTGETGAGKSIIIDSIGFALGNRADRDLIRSGEESAAVEAFFCDLSDETLKKCAECGIEPDEDGNIFIRRTLNTDGKGSVRINGRQVPISILREISGYLVNIHGQHHNGELLNPDKHIDILDAFGETEKELSEYREIYSEYTALCKKLSSLEMDEKEKKRRIDILKFQTDEIKKAKLKNGEEEDLTFEKNKIRNVEKISKSVNTAYDSLYGGNGSVTEKIDRAVNAVKAVSDIIPNADDYLEQLEDFKYRIMDIAELLYENIDGIDEDPDTALDRIESRLDVITKLKMKYGSDIAQILEYLKTCEAELSEIELSDVIADETKAKLADITPRLENAAKKLTAKRTECGKKLSSLIIEELKFLDMNGVKFAVGIKPQEYSSNGADSIEFLVSTNAGEPFKSLSKTASGGELARLMLAIKCVIAEKDSVETMIFDEVDTGVSGKTSRKLGLKLLQISGDREVLCVTHSAQIASLADSHFYVSKSEKNGRTSTSITELTDTERVDEVARIISGIGVTDSAREAARELINNKTF
ncbi:MAG: DNA repair protein RecN [Clostridia bacterium]|nr:DNA repair protein RecN [Clostridia bacterium]